MTTTPGRCAAAVATAALLAAPALAAEKPRIEVVEFRLENGMRWLLFERHESPQIAAGWVAHVGSVNERPGITGISHLFEHMMFKGTRTIGTRDSAADLALIEEQEAVMEQIRAELTLMRERLRRGEIDDLQKPESGSERYRELQRRFAELAQKQRAIIIKDQLDQLYTRNGGEALNAFTSEDVTAYFVRVPSNRLELWAWLESDRLIDPVFREFYSERDVVYEERRLAVESTPLGKFDEAFSALFWEASPYGWPVVGWPSDLPAITKAQADEYFGLYYAPGNLTGVLVGDFKAAEAKALVERYFSRIPAGRAAPPEMLTQEPKQLAEKRYRAEAETSPTVRIWWHGVPFVHADRTVLDLFSDLLSGRTGRLYKGLVQGRAIANQVSAVVDLRKYEGLFQVECVVKDGADPAAVEAAVYEEIERIQKEGVPADELQKVKNQGKAGAYRRLSSPFSIMVQLLQYDGLGDWRYINTYADEVEAVTSDDIQRVAREHFTKENRTVGVFLRKAGTAPEDPELEALAPQARAMVRRGLDEIRSAGDAASLRAAIAELQGALRQAPEEMKPALAYLLKNAEERLATLGGEKQ
jgi:predicted Zn-dependent peptidase